LFVVWTSASGASAYTGATCLAADNESRAACVAMIGAVRELMVDGNSSDPACARVGRDDIAVTDGVIDWIKTRPDRRGDDLANLIREALLSIDPCTQRSLIPQMQPGDPLDVD
jgi:hypothetical protein